MSDLRNTTITGLPRRVGSTRSPQTAEAVDLTAPLLTPRDAAELLGVRTSWVYEAARSGRLPCLRLGRHIRFSRTLLERWLNEQV